VTFPPIPHLAAELIPSNLFLFPLDNNLGSSRSTRGPVAGSHEALTPRQSKFLGLVTEELTYQQIASRLGFSESTISKEAMQIFRKLGVSNRVQAAARVVRGRLCLDQGPAL
jgi:DNA-binding NarL/FixJ family response regulator